MIEFINEPGGGKNKRKEINDLLLINAKAKNLRKDGLYLINKGYIFSIIRNSAKETSGAFFLEFPKLQSEIVNKFIKESVIIISGVELNRIIKSCLTITIDRNKELYCVLKKNAGTSTIKIFDYNKIERSMIKEMKGFYEKYGNIKLSEEIDITDKVNSYFDNKSLFSLIEMPNGNKIKLSKKMVKNIGSKYSEKRRFTISSGEYAQDIYLTRISVYEDDFITRSFYLNINF